MTLMPASGVRHPAWAFVQRQRWAIAAGVFALLVSGAIVLRAPLADQLYPEARAQQLRAAAAQALAQGRLSAADGSGARELYAAALALEPDRDEARTGLQRVADAALAQARTATHRQQFEQAHRALALARELAVPRAAADAVAEQLRLLEADFVGIDDLLARADAARRAGRLDAGDDAALPLYQRVLALQPARIDALEGREDALSDLLQRADGQVARGELAAAAALVARAQAFDAGHVALPDPRARLARAIDARRASAAAALRRGRLEAATSDYRQLLALDAADLEAQAGLARIAQAQAERAERLAADFRFDAAEQALAQARALAPQALFLAPVEQHLAQARLSRARLQAPPRSAQRARRVRALLADAAAAEARGELLTPPGECAFDRVRAARALAPDEPAVGRASARLVPAARDCFERALRGNRLVRAQACLDAWEQLAGAADGSDAARQRLAARWLAVGEERLGAGELAAATHAHAAAQALDPATPGLAAFAERLRAANARTD